MGFLQAGKTVPPVAQPPPATPPAPLPKVSAPPQVRNIAETDLLDKLGLGTWADIAVVSILALFLSVVMIGVMLWVIRKAFGSYDEMKKRHDDAEKVTFDLITREASAKARIEGLKRQVATVEAALSERAI